jgi:hypothetical protein
MNKLLNRSQRARILFKIDLKSEYNLIRNKEGDEEKSSFKTWYSHYKFLVLPFGIANASETSWNMTRELLHDIINIAVIGYLYNFWVDLGNHKEYSR